MVRHRIIAGGISKLAVAEDQLKELGFITITIVGRVRPDRLQLEFERSDGRFNFDAQHPRFQGEYEPKLLEIAAVCLKSGDAYLVNATRSHSPERGPELNGDLYCRKKIPKIQA